MKTVVLYFNLSAKYESIKTQFENKLLPNFNLTPTVFEIDAIYHLLK